MRPTPIHGKDAKKSRQYTSMVRRLVRYIRKFGFLTSSLVSQVEILNYFRYVRRHHTVTRLTYTELELTSGVPLKEVFIHGKKPDPRKVNICVYAVPDQGDTEKRFYMKIDGGLHTSPRPFIYAIAHLSRVHSQMNRLKEFS